MNDGSERDDRTDAITRLIPLELARLGAGVRVPDAEDLSQEVWCAIVSRRPAIRLSYNPEKGSEEAWFRVIIRNIAISRNRRLDRRRIASVSLEELGSEMADDRSRREELSKLRRAIDGAFQALAANGSPMNIEILERRFLRLESVATIAGDLKLSPASVSRRIKKGKAQLKAVLLKQDLDANEPLRRFVEQQINRNSRGRGGPKSGLSA